MTIEELLQTTDTQELVAAAHDALADIAEEEPIDILLFGGTDRHITNTLSVRALGVLIRQELELEALYA